MTMCVSPIVPETASLKLTVTKAVALRHLKQRIEQGVALRRRRVRYVEDLEDVRAEKSAWVQLYTDLLRQMFHGDAGRLVADTCNDWVGRVYPEYAEVELFVEQFYEEMDYRVSRLREVARGVAGMADLPLVPSPTSSSSNMTTEGKVTLLETVGEAEKTSANTAVPAAPAAAAKRAGAPVAVSGVTTAADIKEREPLATALMVSSGERSPASDAVRRFLVDLGVDLVAVRTMPQDGKSAVAALEQGPAAAFAVILLSQEDANRLRDPASCPPTVTFQLGYFVGRLGLPRVCILCENGNEVFHDPHGILCLPLDPANGWHLQLARQLKRSGIEVDLNKLC